MIIVAISLDQALNGLEVPRKKANGFPRIKNQTGSFSTLIPAGVYTSGALTLTPGTVHMHPFVHGRDINVTNLGFVSTTNGTGTVKLAVYKALDNGRPGELVGSTGDITVGSTGYRSGAVNLSLKAGQLYWVVLMTTASLTVRANTSVQQMIDCGWIVSGTTLTPISRWTAGITSYPANLDGVTLGSATGGYPVIFFDEA